MTNNCRVENYAVLDVFHALTDFRDVVLEDGTTKNICDTDVFCFLYTMSSGNKNDHIFHKACVECVTKCQNQVRESQGKTKTTKTVTWTDNCPTQHKCRQNFLYVVMESSRVAHAIMFHKFAEKYFFKGPWDGTGKRIKTFLADSELMNRRCGSAWSYCVVCLEYLSNHTDPKWKELEESRSSELLEKSPCCNTSVTFSFIVESKAELTRL